MPAASKLVWFSWQDTASTLALIRLAVTSCPENKRNKLVAHAAGQRLYAGPFIMMGHTLRFYYSCPSYECKSSMSLCVLVLLLSLELCHSVNVCDLTLAHILRRGEQGNDNASSLRSYYFLSHRLQPYTSLYIQWLGRWETENKRIA